jgi:CTP synthase
VTQRILLRGPGAERAAAALIRAAHPAPTVAAFLGPVAVGDFVTADGRFLPNAALWLEWATGQPLPDGLPEALPLVVAAPDPAAAAIPGFEVVEAPAVPVHEDRFGRPSLARREDAAGDCRIGLLGDAYHHRQVYPAVLARLGDAADRTGIAVEPVLLSADEALTEGVLAGLNGMILPGGADMGQVAPQIRLAECALAAGVPLFGLCLGMQSMATALVRSALWPDAVFEEIDGPGPRRSFVRMRAPNGDGLHRLGDHDFRPLPGSRLGALLPEGAALRMNHRYRFNPEIDTAVMPEAGWHWSGDILDAVEVASHPFFIGLQGHPEIGCDPALAGLWDGFLQAAGEKDTAFA